MLTRRQKLVIKNLLKKVKHIPLNNRIEESPYFCTTEGTLNFFLLYRFLLKATEDVCHINKSAEAELIFWITY